MRVEPKSFDQGRRKNDAFTHSATLPIVKSSELKINKVNKFCHFVSFFMCSFI